MSRFIDRFENHALHKSLENSINTVNELLEIENAQPDALIELERVKQVLFYLKELLDNCDPNLVHMGYLDSIQNSCINNVLSYLNNFRNDRNISQLHSANNHLDSYIPSMTNIATTKFPHDVEGIRESIVSFRRSAAQHLRNTEEDYRRVAAAKTELEQGFSQVSSTVEVQKGRLDTAISDFQQQFSNSEESRRDKFSQAEEQRKNDFELLESEWDEKFKNLKDGSETTFNEYVASFQDKEKQLQEKFKSQAEQYIQTLEGYKSKAAQVLNIISNTSMAGGYQQVADQEKSSRKFWRTVTMITMGLLVIASIYSFFHPIGDKSIWTEIAKRVSVAATLATVAGYASRQAKIHLDAERRYRRMELELTTLSPYLVELEDEKRKEILANMVDQFFGKANEEQVQGNSSNQSNPEISNSVTELSKLFENVLSLINPKK
ncbi:hypothetical protein [Neobacillus soli]|uniref:hypothetical protein n=1 Tax=Neobacillus soli TaxID=220688 RepID=UPI00082609E7|nr:hypothetical protein [Neobacillus soli]